MSLLQFFIMSSVDSESDVEDINRMDHSEILTVLADQEKNGSQDISPERETISLHAFMKYI